MSLKPVLRHPTPSASKNVQIPTVSEFDVVARFRKTIPTVKSVSSSEIYKKIQIFTEITNFPFFEKIRFARGFTEGAGAAAWD